MKNDSPIIGKWIYEGGVFAYCFMNDGSGFYEMAGARMNFKYADDGEAVEILYTGNTIAGRYGYRVEGDTLIIKDSLNNDVIYKKSK